MKKAVLTICSVNYLAQAKTFADSLKKYHSDYTIFLGLVDRLDQHNLNEAVLANFNVLEIHQIGIPDFNSLVNQYNITELNTAVKPYLLKYIYENFPEIEILHYFDPDIQFFGELSAIEEGLKEKDLFLTPHILSPYQDAEYYRPRERDHLNGGIYNLGFLGTKRSEITFKVLDWWAERLSTQGYIDLANGMFVDQLWMNFIPNYFPDHVFISRNIGLNMAYWNFHERKLTEKNGQYFVNDETPLLFFHYSGYSPDNPTQISKYQNRFEFTDKHDIASIFDGYAQLLTKNGHSEFKKYPCYYIKPEIVPPRKRFLRVRKYLSMPFQAISDFINTVHI